ncbi:2-methoxy-6-polyprenyl-1,4-benzoquinol methylase, mitochondrial [Candidatus Lokiarchaeum ossiferum]|uniref:2-methoxy-6-polyprenyl-1,4-benzoquinol methylase, mitochondrial n=1 Tax=Candidatus Lokiarchaeum ossiferum TaxID=2951803 RepID=A0ABY6HTP7_9ARCH|nr:2-methoxy-6-polyprenyl-1,4-benzoquinol methylase, mitochondrial [Candidatus Lokiarchaeum sp. B-35]
MSQPYIHRPPLYRFLRNIIDVPLEKTILDCGAGGKVPPLALFQSYGFKTTGIDISEEQIKRANEYCKKNNVDLNIQYGDMTKIPFEDESFSYVYSTGSIFHLTKKDSGIAIQEMLRVLKKGGYLYVDFLNTDDGEYGKGEAVDPINSPGEFHQKERGNEVLHSYYEDNEADRYFNGVLIELKNKNNMEILHEGTVHQLSFIEYIIKKI